MTEIPADVMKIAMDALYTDEKNGLIGSDQVSITVAAYAARLIAAERERCARIVDEMGGGLMDRTPAEAAAAIRGRP